MKTEYKKEIIVKDLKGLAIYEKPFVFRITKDLKSFYYSEVGVIVNCSFHKEEAFLNPKMCNKYVLTIQYDYRSSDDLQKFGFVKESGTYGEQFICETIDEAIGKTLEFLSSDFEFATYEGKKVTAQKNIVAVREVSKSQCLHHYSSYERLYNSNDLMMKIIEASGELETLKKYIQINKNRHNAELKYSNKLSKKFNSVFGFDLMKCIYNFTFDFYKFKKLAGLNHFDELQEIQKPIIKKVLHYYN